MKKLDFRSLVPYLVPVLVILLCNIVYFLPQFSGKEVEQGDIIQYKGMAKEAIDFEKSTGEDALWTNSMFGGMPTYQINTKNKGNLLGYVDRVFNLGLKRPAGMFIAGMLGFYLLLLLLGVNPWLSMIGALFFGLSTNNLILYEAGHVTKLRTIMYGAPALAGMILVYKQKYLIGGSVFALFLGINIFANHPQMTYYLGFVMLIFGLIYLISAIRSKTLVLFLKSTLVIAVAGVLAVGASTSQLWTTYEYSNSTMRGKPILTASGGNVTSSSETDGLEWSYAMSWSIGAKDLLASFIPKAVGGGSGEWVDKDSYFSKKMQIRKDIQIPTYWGDLPFTSGPSYFGAIVIFLFLFGAFVVKGEVKWWLVASVVLTFLLAMGKNFPILNQTLYDYFPLFNKFRTPNSVLSITAILLPILAILGLSELVKNTDKQKFLKPLYISFGVLASLCVFLYLFGTSFFSFSGKSDANYEQFIDVLIEQRKLMLKSSALNTLLLISLVAGLIWAFIKSKINTTTLLIGVGLIGVGDLFINGKSYLSERNFVSIKQYQQNFSPRPVDTQILQDNDPNFRVYDATINTFNSSKSSYFHKTIGGYHAAKLQRFQDIIDRHISKDNQNVLNMLNTKYYIVTKGEGEESVIRNPAALGNAWFVNNIIKVSDANAEIDSLSNFDPAGDVIIHEEFADYVQGLSLSKNGDISLTKYTPNRLEYTVDTQGDQFAVFSEIWYGPNKGWQASIDGQPVDHIRVNYLLRGLKVPSGQHQIVFEFVPKSFFTGAKIAFICSLLILLLSGFTLYSIVMGNLKEVGDEL